MNRLMTKGVSFLVPFRDTGGRGRLWDYIRGRIEREMPWAEIVVSDSLDQPFNKARSINEAALKASCDTFAIWDADSWIPPEQVQQALDLIGEKYRWSIPYRVKHKISEEATERFLLGDERDYKIRPERTVPQNRWGAPPIILPREGFEVVGGMDERFSGYGYEDDCFSVALDGLWGRRREVSGDCIHLFHSRVKTERGAVIWEGQEGDNRELRRRYKAARGRKDALLKLISEPGHH